MKIFKAALLILTVLAAPARAATLVVTNTADSGAGTLRNLVASANPGDTISFTNTLSGATILLTGGEIVLNKNLIIDGASLANPVQLNGSHTNRIFTVNSGTTNVLNSLTISNGYDATLGGNIYNQGTLTVNNCTLAGGNTTYGGGICNTRTLTVNNCTFTGNTGAGGGGGMLNLAGATMLTVNNCTFAGNISGGSGGGLFNQSLMTVNNCTLVNNSGSNAGGAGGGGIYNDNGNGGTTLLTNSIVCSNTISGNPDNTYGSYSGANNLVDSNALLALLGNYGGPTQTMPPLPGSPALNAGSDTVTNFLATDQRGYPRMSGAQVDIGAVEVGLNLSPVVLNNNDSGAGSLRQAVADADSYATITFTNTLSGSTILLTNGEIVLDKNLTIDGSALASAVQLNGNGASRIFSVNSGTTNVLNSLTITNGYTAPGTYPAGLGGAIYTEINASLVVSNCTVAGSSAGNGGGIYSQGTLLMNSSAVVGNSALVGAALGGGVVNAGTVLTMNNSTVANNLADNGGGIFCASLTTNNLVSSTVAGNSASSDGGGIYNQGGTLNLTNSIVASNTGSTGSNTSGSISSGANNLTSDNARLAPLANYGGPTQTMPPLPGSPAIDAGAATTLTTDQRGFARVVGAAVDIGAVEAGNAIPGFNPVVTVNSDVVDGDLVNGVSLREATAFATNGSTITFTNTLSGSTILLTNGEIVLDKNLTIDGSALANQIKLDGNQASRIFTVNSGTTNVLNSLTITNGFVAGGGGGGIFNSGTLTINNSTLAGGHAVPNGGAVFNASTGTLKMNNSTLAGNSATSNGGALFNSPGGIAALAQCTFSGNSASNSFGGAILNDTGATLTLAQCTISGNFSTSLGGAVFNGNNVMTMTNCIVAQNTSAADGQPDISNVSGGNLMVSGVNFIGDLSGSGLTAGATILTGNPLLVPLGNYGGPTPTMPPLPGSPAIDAGLNSAASGFTYDQRGTNFARILGGIVDIGAVESQVCADSVTVNSATICAGSPVSLTATNTATNPVYLWSNGETSQSITVSPTSTTNYVVSVFDSASGCIATATSTVTVSPTSIVVTNLADSGPGTLRQAVLDVCSGTITFAPGLSGQTILLTSGQIVLDKNLTIDGSALANAIQLNGNQASRIFTVNGGVTSVLNSLTITNGSTSGEGGGILNYGTLTLTRCDVVGNTTTSGGGGIENNGGTLTVNESSIRGNNGGAGGGIETYAGGSVTLSNSTICSNSATYGGGINGEDLVTVNQCTIAGNTGSVGGGFRAYFSTLNLNQSTVSQNTGDGIFSENGNVDLVNSIVAGNSGLNISGADPTTVGVNLTNGVPFLAPLDNYGGRTLTMPPLPGSPAIDGCTNGTTFTTDQRGFARVVGAAVDIGAVELQNTTASFLMVNTDNDAVDGYDNGIISLRKAVKYAPINATITFSNNLSGQTILLTNGQIVLNKSLAIDGSSLASAVQVNGNNASRLFEVSAATINTLSGLVLTGGNGTGATSSGNGGAIYVAGALTLTHCTLTGNVVPSGRTGGALHVTGASASVSVQNSTFSTNRTSGGSNGGGAIYATTSSHLDCTDSTFVGNSSPNTAGAIHLISGASGNVLRCIFTGNAATDGGAVRNTSSTLNLANSTMVGNTATNLGGGIFNNSGNSTLNNVTLAGNLAATGGGIRISGGTLNMTNSIICSNTAASGANVSGTIAASANNLMDANALLAPLGNYGGPTRTMPLLPGSSAIDAGAATTLTTDQRGLPRVVGAAVDIGAVEGVFNPSFSLISPAHLGNGAFQFSFANLSGASFTVWASTDVTLPLAQWSNLGAPVESPAGTFTFTDPQATNSPQRFYRVSRP